MNTWTVLKSFYDKKWHDRYELYSSLKDECITEKDCLHAINSNKAGLLDGSFSWGSRGRGGQFDPPPLLDISRGTDLIST